MIDNRTTNLELLLPNSENDLEDDVQRISESFDILDGAIHEIIENGSFPDQSGHAGKFLKTDGENVLWDSADAFPSQTNQAGKFLKTNGFDVIWDEVKQKSDVDYVQFFNENYGVALEEVQAWEAVTEELGGRISQAETDIDNVMTSVNNKLDRDLSNVVGDAVERVVEQGDNFIRYASGKQECWAVLTFSSIPAKGIGYATWTLPKAFKDMDFSVVGMRKDNGYGWTSFTGFVHVLSSSSVRVGEYNNENTAFSGQSYEIRVIAIGRWK